MVSGRVLEDFMPIFYLFMFIGLGLLCKIVFRGRRVFEDAVHLLSSFLYYILIPVVFFNVFMKRGLGVVDASILAVSTIYVSVSVVSLLFIMRRYPVELRNAVVIASTFQNAIFLGFPVIMLFYGTLHVAAMYSLIVFIYHIAVAGFLAASESSILRQLFKIPLLYGFAAGVIAHSVLPPVIIDSLSRILDPASPLLSYSATFVLGATIPLSFKPVLNEKFPVLLIGLWRFIVSPIIHYAAITLIGLEWVYGEQLIILSLMPPAVMNTVLARIYNWHPELVAGATMIHTFISLFIIIWVLLTGAV